MECSTRAEAMARLAEALGAGDQRDRALSALQSCSGFAPGFVIELRAELNPECAEPIARGAIERPPEGVALETYQALRGVVLASRMARLPADLPPPASHRSDRALEYLERRVVPWLKARRQLLAWFEQQTTELTPGFYGHCQAELALAAAYASASNSAINAPIPMAWRQSAEVRQSYYGSLRRALDEVLDQARRTYLRAAKAASHQGLLDDPRVVSWLGPLVESAQGLQGLLLPSLGRVPADTPNLEVASLLPTYHTGVLFGDDPNLLSPSLLRAMLVHGFPMPIRRALAGRTLDWNRRLLVARARLRLGLVYHQTVQFRWALRALEPDTAQADAGLEQALGYALAPGPEDLEAWLSNTRPRRLDVSSLKSWLAAHGNQNEQLAGLAQYDWAYLNLVSNQLPMDASEFRRIAQELHRGLHLLPPGQDFYCGRRWFGCDAEPFYVHSDCRRCTTWPWPWRGR